MHDRRRDHHGSGPPGRHAGLGGTGPRSATSSSKIPAFDAFDLEADQWDEGATNVTIDGCTASGGALFFANGGAGAGSYTQRHHRRPLRHGQADGRRSHPRPRHRQDTGTIPRGPINFVADKLECGHSASVGVRPAGRGVGHHREFGAGLLARNRQRGGVPRGAPIELRLHQRRRPRIRQDRASGQELGASCDRRPLGVSEWRCGLGAGEGFGRQGEGLGTRRYVRDARSFIGVTG